MSVYEGHGVTLHHADCLDVLRSLPDCSVDSVVCDPPYALGFMGREWDTFGMDVGRGAQARSQRRAEVTPTGEGHSTSAGPYLASGVDSLRAAGLPFQRWCEAWATECLRVLKPGGHLLAFGGTRTWHRLACAVEDAGFEVRDSIAWLYGSGFPKSLDVSKAIDKRRTEDAEPVRAICRAIRAAMDVRDLRSRHLVEHFDGCHPRLIDHWAARDTDSQPALPTWEQWERLRDLFAELAEHDAEAWRLNGRKGTPGEAWEGAEVIGTTRGIDTATSRLGFVGATYGGTSAARDYDVKAPASPESQSWQGWGTALKPAFEPVVVARKPLAGTVAANVLAHGTGALNIDGCRIEHDEPEGRPSTGMHGRRAGIMGETIERHRDTTAANTSGRWPANVVLDESQAEALDEQSGTLTSGLMRAGTKPKGERETYGQDAAAGYETARDTPGDSGGASRFFYVAKADASERPRYKREGGSDNATTYGQMKKRECNVCGNRTCPAGGEQSGKPWPTCGHDDWSWVEQQSARDEFVAHPTVKPLSLMRWLVRLVTPPGGTVLEPFAGSGTTVEACIVEGFQCIAIEREADYLPLIRQRIDRRRDPVEALRGQAADLGLFDLLGGEGA